MRIISGEFGGRKFYPPADNWPTRPTTDYAREALFNVLQNKMDFDQVRFLDLFGGTGSHSIEMISRGCTDATYVEKFKGCILFVKTMSEKLKIDNRLHIHQDNVFRFCKSKNIGQFNCIFADPPFSLPTLGQIPDLIFDNNLLTNDGLFILEHDGSKSFVDHVHFTETRKYGHCHFSLFKINGN